VLLLGEDGVVGLEVVLLQQGLVTDGLDVCDCDSVSDKFACLGTWSNICLLSAASFFWG
jgi:hypothetical protein